MHFTECDFFTSCYRDILVNYRVRYFRGRVTNFALLLAEEGSQITTFGGTREKGHKFNFLDSELLAGEGYQVKILPP